MKLNKNRKCIGVATINNKPKKITIILLYFLTVLLICYGLGQSIKSPAKMIVKLQADDIEKAVMHQNDYYGLCHYGSWEIGQEESEEILNLVQAAARSVTDNHNPYNFVNNVIKIISRFIPHGGPGRGPILSFVTKGGNEIKVGVWYDSLEINGCKLLADKVLCDAIEAFNLEQVNLRTNEIAVEKVRIETISVSDIAAVDIVLATDKPYTLTPQESEEILQNLSQSLATNTTTDEKVWHVENYVSYYLFQFPHYKKSGNEISIYLECLDGEMFVVEVDEEIIILNGLPYRVDAEINAALEQTCRAIYNSNIA